jgi:hypothetical protein
MNTFRRFGKTPWTVDGPIARCQSIQDNTVPVPVLSLTQHQAMKAYCGSGGTAHPFFDLGTRRRWVVSFTPHADIFTHQSIHPSGIRTHDPCVRAVRDNTKQPTTLFQWSKSSVPRDVRSNGDDKRILNSLLFHCRARAVIAQSV